MPPIRFALALAAALALPAGAAEHVHQHGVVSLSVSLDGAVLSVDLDAPLDSLLGFERAPRTAQEKAAAAAVLRQLDPGAAVFQPNAEAGCVLTQTRVNAPVLQQAKPPAGEHADLEASYQFRCEQPARLTRIQQGLFTAFARIQRVEAQFALPAGQGKRVLKRPEAGLVLTR